MLVLLFALITPCLAAPSGYNLITQGRGVSVWQQDVAGGEPDFVVEVDLDIASLESVIDPVGDSLNRHTVTSWWNTHAVPDQFATINGAFFAANVTPTQPAFGLRTPDYTHVGYGTNIEHIGEQVALWLEDDGGANLYPADPSTLDDPNAPTNQIVALTVDANKRPNSLVARTFLGLKDNDDGAHRTALLFVSKLSTQPYAEAELARWGATQQFMLDGASSAHLVVQGTALVPSGRAVPHLIRVVEGPDLDSDTEPDIDTDMTVDTDADVDTERDVNSDTQDDTQPTERGCTHSAASPPSLGALLWMVLAVARRTRRTPFADCERRNKR